jgi:dolichyl-phosphate-mannose--protein O-mannosyl transferase
LHLTFIASLLLGFAMGCKLSALVVWPLFFIIYAYQWWATKKISVKTIAIFSIVPLFAYALCFVPYSFYPVFELPFTFGSFWTQQTYMWNFHRGLNLQHNYQSEWYTWAILIRPIWYAFEKNSTSTGFFGVLLIGNPLLMWAGIPAMGFVAWEWFWRRSLGAFFVLASYLVLYLSWAVIPRKIKFYYYYYPAAVLLTIGLVFVMVSLAKTRFRWVNVAFLCLAMVFFAFFYPLLSFTEMPSRLFQKWMWLRSWI